MTAGRLISAGAPAFCARAPEQETTTPATVDRTSADLLTVPTRRRRNVWPLGSAPVHSGATRTARPSAASQIGSNQCRKTGMTPP